jgi:delta24-sterol reductase
MLEFIVGQRWLFAILLLPISFVYDVYWCLRSKYILFRGSAPSKHQEHVDFVQKQVLDWQIIGNGRKMCTARPTWMSITQQQITYKDKAYKVEIQLMDILKIDPEQKIVRCEPLVTVERLVEALTPQGWIVPIVPEIGGLTVGGLVMGGGIESTSHKYGLWQNICMRYELVLADGTVTTCSREENSDLFYAIPWSYGTLGFLTAVDLMIIPFKPYIKLVYEPTYSLQETMEVFTRETRKDNAKLEVVDENDNDSVEGIMFTKEKGVVMTGTFTNSCERNTLNRIGLWYKPWFYKHVETFLKKGQRVEYIPTIDFLFRHNKPFYWLTHIWVPFGHNVIFRWLFGWMLPYNYGLLKKIREAVVPEEATNNFVLQDFGLPLRHLTKAIEFFHQIVNVYPIWLCPAKAMDTGPVKALKDESKDPIHVDIGLYGYSPIPNFDPKDALKQMEKFTRDHSGYQGLYAETLMSREEFFEMFDSSHYIKVRKSLPFCEEAFPEVYDKISKLGRK